MAARVLFTAGFSRRYTAGVREFTVEARNLRGVIKEMGRCLSSPNAKGDSANSPGFRCRFRPSALMAEAALPLRCTADQRLMSATPADGTRAAHQTQRPVDTRTRSF